MSNLLFYVLFSIFFGQLTWLRSQRDAKHQVLSWLWYPWTGSNWIQCCDKWSLRNFIFATILRYPINTMQLAIPDYTTGGKNACYIIQMAQAGKYHHWPLPSFSSRRRDHTCAGVSRARWSTTTVFSVVAEPRRPGVRLRPLLRWCWCAADACVPIATQILSRPQEEEFPSQVYRSCYWMPGWCVNYQTACTADPQSIACCQLSHQAVLCTRGFIHHWFLFNCFCIDVEGIQIIGIDGPLSGATSDNQFRWSLVINARQ